MALQNPIVTLIGVSEIQPDRYSISLNLKVVDDEIGYDGINMGFTMIHKQGTPMAKNMQEVRQAMQAEINKYKRAKAIRNLPSLATFITNLQGNLNM